MERQEAELDGATFQPAITKKAWELKMREGSVPDKDKDAKWSRMYKAGIRKVGVQWTRRCCVLACRC
jgi:hypothetical protein